MTDITMNELEKAAMSLVKLLREKGNPHCAVVVKTDGVELLSGEIGIRLPYED